MAKASEKEYLTPTRTELVWPGKRTQVERIALPFQVVETVNQSRATREQTPMLTGLPAPPLFEARPDTSWKNKLIWGENKYVMASLLQGDPSIGLEPLAGKIDLIYIDPPFATGADFSINMKVGDAEWTKEASIIEEKAYRDTWGKGLDSYLQMLYERLVLMKDLLSDTGSIYVHLDWHVGHYVKLIMDEIFGKENFRNEIIWHYRGGALTGVQRYFPRKHDTILFYTKTENYIFNQLHEDAVSEQMLKRWGQYADEDGNITFGKIEREGATYERSFKTFVREHGREPRADEVAFTLAGPLVRNVWVDIPEVRASARYVEYVGFPTQKPEALLERIIKASSNEGNLVADFFCGSGTMQAVAEKLGRRWIGGDLSRFAIQVTRKRLLDIAGCQPFEVLNLGKYERRHWQMNVLNGEQEDGSRAIADYLRFIVALYHAEPVEGYAHLHGQKAGRWVHVGATDASVTRNEVMDAVRECQANRYTALDVLGWEWEMGLHDTVRDEARRLGVDLRLLYIPREVMDKRAVEAGDVHFYELAYLKTSLLQDGQTVTIRLDDFIIPNPDLVPDEVRSKVKKWSDYIDFWAVDWNYAGGTFHNEWQTYRTRKSPTLRLISDPHTYAEPGKYRILVKVIDIFGNDTTQVLEVAVS
ncbi:site-specific DNA-methyltransferase [Dehalococcoidia bacterium]|nr:site-specific DNA-methyltransferase [Dehalococcoidia bacterium]